MRVERFSTLFFVGGIWRGRIVRGVRGVRVVRGKCRMQNAECKMQNAKLFFLPKFPNFSNFHKFSKSKPFQKPPYFSSEGVRCGASQKKRPRDRQPMTLTIIMGEGIF